MAAQDYKNITLENSLWKMKINNNGAGRHLGNDNAENLNFI